MSEQPEQTQTETVSSTSTPAPSPLVRTKLPEKYRDRLRKMSTRQLRGEIKAQQRKAVRANQAEGIILTTILRTVFDSKVEPYIR